MDTSEPEAAMTVTQYPLQPTGSVPNTDTGPDGLGTIIIGAGQTGLATAYFLGKAGLPCVVLEECDRVGDQWRARYDSLMLNSPARYDSLPGMRFPAPPGSYPSGRDMADYLESYVAEMGIQVRAGMPVSRVERQDDGSWAVTAGGQTLVASNVVVASGCERLPKVPEFAAKLDPGIRQIHSSAYRNPGQLLPGPVLVVGAGQSGADIALEVRQAGFETTLAGVVHGEVPVPFGSRRQRFVLPALWFAVNHVLTTRTPIGRKMRPFVRSGGAPLLRVRRPELAAAGVRLIESRAVGAEDGLPVLENGQAQEVANVIWCTGYTRDFGFIHPSVTDSDGWPLDDGGVVASAPGLYFMGLLFQRGFYSMLIGGAGRDAAFIADQIAARESSRARQVA
jgi:putative flavoprotein involved in K+ transport